MKQTTLKPEQEWYTKEEVAELFGCSTATIYRRIRDGKLTAYNVGSKGMLRIHATDINAMLTPTKGDPQ